MIRRLITFFITGALLLFIVALIWPQRAERIATKALSGLQELEETRLPLPGYKEPALKIVDPEIISSVIKEESSNLAALFRKQRDEGIKLAIEDIIDETNKRRIAEGLVPLKTNALLIESATTKTEDMILRQYFEHESPTGESVSDLGADVGYDYIIMGENLALGDFKNANDLVQAWMDSPGHRANIMSTLYQEIGVYAAKGTYEGREVWFAVQHFGTGRTACPSVSKTLRTAVDALDATLDTKQIDIEKMRGEIERMNSNNAEYEAKVDTFNQLISDYNELLKLSQQKISEYNKQVSQFNLCLLRYQK